MRGSSICLAVSRSTMSALPAPKTLCGVVVSAGKMMKAVKVRTAKQVYNAFLRKHFKIYHSHLVSDPNDSLRTGDVVRIGRGGPSSRNLKHVVLEILAPWGPAIEERPRVLSEVERLKILAEKRDRKSERRRKRREGESEAEEIEESGKEKVSRTS